VTLEKHVRLRALALGLPDREVLYVSLMSTDCSGRWPLDSLTGVPIRDSSEHVSFRALALGLPYRGVLIRDS
jgi:hypothetical protein